MPTTIRMPQLGESVTEGTVAQWLKRVGDVVEKYEPFVEVSTDKVNAEVPAPVAGTLRELIVKEGETVPTGAPIAIIDEHESNGKPAAAAAPIQPAQIPPPAPPKPLETASAAPARPAPRAGVLGASPAVRRLARERGIDLATLRGTGAQGRVTANDVLAAAQSSEHSSYRNPIRGTTIPLTQARRIIAQRTVESKRTAPHAWTLVEVDVTNLVAWRNRLKEDFERRHGVKLTLLPFFLHAVAGALVRHPLMNSKFTGDAIAIASGVHLCVAVALEDNLVAPVIKNADLLSIGDFALAARALIERARRGKLGADEMTGGTFTVNNTGANGSIASAPIINDGQAGIITMEAAVRRPVVVEGDAIAIRTMMNVCLSIDHRVVNGSTAGAFLATVKRRLELMGPAGSL